MFDMDDDTRKQFDETVKARMAENKERIEKHLEVSDYMREERKTNYRQWKSGKKWVYSAGMLTVLLGQTAMDIGVGVNRAVVAYAATVQDTNGPIDDATGQPYTNLNGQTYGVTDGKSSSDNTAFIQKVMPEFNNNDYYLVGNVNDGSTFDSNDNIYIIVRRSDGKETVVWSDVKQDANGNWNANAKTLGKWLAKGESATFTANSGTQYKVVGSGFPTSIADGPQQVAVISKVVGGNSKVFYASYQSAQTTKYVDETGKAIGPGTYVQYGIYSRFNPEQYSTAPIKIPGYNYVSKLSGAETGGFSPLANPGDTITMRLLAPDGVTVYSTLVYTLLDTAGNVKLEQKALVPDLWTGLYSGGTSTPGPTGTDAVLTTGSDGLQTITWASLAPGQLPTYYGYYNRTKYTDVGGHYRPMNLFSVANSTVTYSYQSNTQLLNVNFVDASDGTTTVKDLQTLSGKTNAAVDYSTVNKVVQGYTLTEDPINTNAAPATYDATDMATGATDPTPQSITLKYTKSSEYQFKADRGTPTLPDSQGYNTSTTNAAQIDTTGQTATPVKGYTAFGPDGTALSTDANGNYILPVPEDKTQPTVITYKQDMLSQPVKFYLVNEDGQTSTAIPEDVKATPAPLSGYPGDTIDYSSIDTNIEGYVLDSTRLMETFDESNAESAYFYNKVGNYTFKVDTPEDGTTTPDTPASVPYPNDPSDSSKVLEPGDDGYPTDTVVPYVPGYTPQGPDGTDLTQVDKDDPTKGYIPPDLSDPTDPTAPTEVTYTADTQKLVVNFVDASGNVLKTADDSITGKSSTPIDYSSMTAAKKAIEGYYITDDQTLEDNANHIVNFDSDTTKNDEVSIVYDELGQFTPVGPEGDDKFKTPDPVDYPGSTEDPTKAWDDSNTPKIPPVDGYTPTTEDGTPLDPIYDDDGTTIVGYEPPAVTNPGEDTTIKYVAESQTVNVIKVLDSDKTTIVPGTDANPFSEKGNSNATITYKDLVKGVTGYLLVEDGTETTTTFDATNNEGSETDKTPQEVKLTYKKLGQYVPKIETPTDGTETPETPDPVTYPNDPDDPTVPGDPSDGVPPIEYVPGYTPLDPTTNEPLEQIDKDDPTKGYVPPAIPEDPTTNTTITYVADEQVLDVKFLDASDKELQGAVTLGGDSSTPVDYTNSDKVKFIEGYYITSDQTDKDDENFVANYDSDSKVKQTAEIRYAALGQFTPSSDDPNFPGNTDPIEFPGNTDDPTKPWNGPEDPGTDNVPDIPHYDGYTPTTEDGTPLDPIYGDDGTTITGYEPPAGVNPGDDVKIIYKADTQKVTVDQVYKDPDTGLLTTVPGTSQWSETGNSNGTITWDGLTKAIPGYIIATDGDGTEGVTKFDDTDNGNATEDSNPQAYTILYTQLGSYVPVVNYPEGSTDTPKTYDETPYQNNPNDPGDIIQPGEDGFDPNGGGDTPIIPYVPGYTPVDPSGKPLNPIKDANDNITGYTPPIATDPGQDTTVNYYADDQMLHVNYVDGDNGNAVLQPYTELPGQSFVSVDYSGLDKYIEGYYVSNDQTEEAVEGHIAAYDDDKDALQELTITYRKLGHFEFVTDDDTPSGFDKPADEPYPGSETTPTDPWDDTNTPTIPYVPGYTPTVDGKELTPITDNDGKITGYIPPVPASPSDTTTVTYSPAAQQVAVHFLKYDDSLTDPLNPSDAIKANTVDVDMQASGESGDLIDYDAAGVTDAKYKPGYTLKIDGTETTTNYDTDKDTAQNVYLYYVENGAYVPNIPANPAPENPDYPTDIPDDPVTYPTDIDDPGNLIDDPSDPRYPTIPYVPGYTPEGPDGEPLDFKNPDDPSEGYIPPAAPTDPTADTPINYVLDKQIVNVTLVDESGALVPALKNTYLYSGDSYAEVPYDDPTNTLNKSVSGYYLITDGSKDVTYFDNDAKTPQDVKLVYGKLGQFSPESDDPNFPGIPTPSETEDPDGDGKINYPGDPDDPSAPFDPENPPVIPYVPGYTPEGPDGEPLEPVSDNPEDGYLPPKPKDNGEDTKINYVVAKQTVNVDFVLDSDKTTEVQDPYTEDGTTGATIKYTDVNKVVDGYYMISDGTEGVTKFDDTDNEPEADDSDPQNMTVTYGVLGSYKPVIDAPTDSPNKPTTPADVQYPNDPDDPSKPGDATTTDDGDPIIPYVPGYTPRTDPDDPTTELTPITDPDDPDTIIGYVPPTPKTPNGDTTVTYVPSNQFMQVYLQDKDGGAVTNSDNVSEYTDNIQGPSNTEIDYSSVNRSVPGYYLISDETTGEGIDAWDETKNTWFDNTDDPNDQKTIITYDKLGQFEITTDDPDNFPEPELDDTQDPDGDGNINYPGDPNTPEAAWPADEPPMIPYVPGYTPTTDDGTELTPIKEGDTIVGYEPPTPATPGTSVTITYKVAKQTVNVDFVLASDGKTAVPGTTPFTEDGTSGADITYDGMSKVVDGYYMIDDGTDGVTTFDDTDNEPDADDSEPQNMTITYGLLGNYVPVIDAPTDSPNKPSTPAEVQYPNDPDDPSKPGDATTTDDGDPIIPYVPGYEPEGPDGQPLDPVDPADPSQGYVPPVPKTSDGDTTVTYKALSQGMIVYLEDEAGNPVTNADDLEDYSLTGDSNTKVNFSSVNRNVPGYYLVSDETTGDGLTDWDETAMTWFDNSEEVNDQEAHIVYKKLASFVPDSDDPHFPSDTPSVTYPGDPTDPTAPWGPDNEPVIPYVPGYTPLDPETGDPLTPIKDGDTITGYEPPVPKDNGTDTTIEYTADTQKAVVNLMRATDNEPLKNTDDVSTYDNLTGTTGSAIGFDAVNKVVTNYVVINDPTLLEDNANFDNVTGTDQIFNIEYKAMGQFKPVIKEDPNVPTDEQPDAPADMTYPNDPNDPTAALNPNDPDTEYPSDSYIPNVPGYTPQGPDGQPLKEVVPGDPSKGYYPPEVTDPTSDTTITYVVDGQVLNVVFRAGDTVLSNKDGEDSVEFTGPSAMPVNYAGLNKVVEGYYMTTDGTTDASNAKFDEDDNKNQEVVIQYAQMGAYTPKYDETPADPNAPKLPDPIVYPNDPDDPTKPSETTPVIPHLPGYTPAGPDGQPLDPVDPDDPTKGYVPPAADPENPGADIDITYVADAQKMLVRFYDAKDTSETPTELKQTITLDGQSYETVDYTVDGEAIDKLVPGYVLVSDEIVDKATDDSIAKYDNDKSVNQEAILLYDKLGSVEFKVDTTEDGNTETPDVPSDFVYPNDPDDVSKTLDPQDPDYPLTKDGDPVVPYIPGYTPTLDDGTELTPIDSTDPEKGYYPPAVPSDPTASTTVTYKQDAAAVQVDLVDQDGNAVPDHTASYTIDGKTNDKVDYSSVDKVVKGYFMTSDDTTTDAFKYYDDAADDSEPSQKALIKYDVLGSYDFTVTPPDDTDESYTPPVTPDDIQYTNDPDDPKLPMDPSNPDYPTSGNVPYVPGYTPEGPDGQPLTPISNNPEDGYLPPAPDPENPGADIKINYVADDQKVNVSYWLEDDTTQINDKKVVSYEGKTGQSIGYKDLNKSLKGYILKTDGTETTVSYDNLDGDQEVHLNYAVLGNYDFEITPPDEATTPPKVPVDSIQYPNDPDDPTVPYDSSDVDYPDDPDAVIVPDVPGYTPEGPDGAPLVPVDPTDPSKGWLPPLPEDPTKDTTVTYVANDQNVKVQLVDEDGNLLDVEGVTPEYPITGKTGTKIDYSSVDKVVPGYYIDTDDTTTVTTFDDSAKDQIVKITYKELGQFTPSSDEPSFPGVPEDAVGEDGNIDYPGNPQDPTKAWNGDNGDYDDTDDTDDNVPVIPYVPGFTPRDPSTNQPLTPVDSNDPSKGYLPPAVTDPSSDTKINYSAWAQVLDVNLYEEGTTKYVTNTDSLDSYALTGKSLAEVDYSGINKVVPGYVLVDDETVSSHDNFIEKFDDTDNTQQAAVQARRALRAATSVEDTEHQEANIYYATVGSYEFTVDPGDDATPPTPPTDIAYPNDPDDPEKVDVTNVVIPPVDGYTPTTEDGTPLTPIKDEDGNVTGYEPPVPADPTTPTPITYQPDTQEAQVRLVDGDGNELKTPIDFSGKTGTPIDLEKVEDSDKVVPGYYIVDDGTKTPTNFDNQTDVTQYVDVVYGELKDFTPTSDDPNFPGSTDPIPYPGSETDPKVPWDDTNVPNIPYVPGYTPTDPSGQPLTPVDPDDPTKGYNPPTPASPGQSTVINYVAGTQTVNVKFLDNKGNEVQGAFSEDGTSLADITWDGMNKVVTGYIMQSDETLGVDKFDDTDNLPGEADKTPQNYVVTYAKAGRWVPEITPGDNTNPPKVPGAIDYPNDPSDPEGIDPSDVVVPYVPGYTPTTDDGTPLTPVDPEDPSKGYLPPDVTDPTKDTTITYNEAPQNLTVRFVDANGKSLANASGVKSTMMSGLSDSEVDYSGVNKVVPGYYLVTDGSLDMTHYDNLSDVDQLVDLVYAQLGGIRPGSDDPDFPGVPDIQWPGDPNDPSAPFDPENPPVIPYVPGYTPVDGDGNPLDPVDPDDPEAGYKVPNVDDPSDWLKINYTKDPDMDISSNLENSEPVEGPEKAEKESKKSPEAKAPVEEAAAPSPAVSSTTPLRVATPVPVAYPIVPNESSVSNAALPETGDEQATMGLVGLALVGIVAMLKRRKKKGISFALVNGSTTTKHWKR